MGINIRYLNQRACVGTRADYRLEKMDISLVVLIALVNLIFFGFIALMVKWRTDLKREQIRAEGRGNSLGTGELRSLIQEAMLDAIAPLEDRLELMEMHQRQSPDHDAKTIGPDATHPDDPNEN